jgi:uncharacterized surface protein with fasciclin (FAS1) repeats
MKKAIIIICLILSGLTLWTCKQPLIEAGFKDMLSMTIYDYLVENKDDFSSFLSILEKAGIDKTLSAYNPNGTDYTLFLPDNAAIDDFIKNNKQFNSLNDLLNNTEYVKVFARYHVINVGIATNDFPFGAFSEPTLSEDYLTVSFIIEKDTSYYKINNQSPVIKPNIEVSNGYIHIVQKALTPITYTSYDWLEQNSGFSIFKAAVDLTGLKNTLDINKKTDPTNLRPFTMFIEPDSVYKKRNIQSISDLEQLISPGNTNYTDKYNPLYNFVAYHLIEEERFLDDFEEIATNYSTYSDVPLNIDGTGLDIWINKGKEVFDTFINGTDTTIVDYIGINYDASNVLTQSGSIHFIDQIMKQQKPSRAITTYEFFEEPVLNEYRKEAGSYLIENPASLYYIKWTGPDLVFVKSDDNSETAYNGDYLIITGDFTITYIIPSIVQGKYDVYLGADAYSQQNALIELFIDNKKIGGLIDLTTGGTSSAPIPRIDLGTVDFIKYDKHTITIKSLIPGRFKWDYIRFEPNQ